MFHRHLQKKKTNTNAATSSTEREQKQFRCSGIKQTQTDTSNMYIPFAVSFVIFIVVIKSSSHDTNPVYSQRIKYRKNEKKAK